jgi:hypothetical protein
MMNMIQFLREKKIISSKQIIEGLVFQRKKSPSYFEILIEVLKNDDEKVLNILASAMDSQDDLKIVASKLLDKNLLEQINQSLSVNSISLLRSLVELGHLDQSQIDQIIGDLHTIVSETPLLDSGSSSSDEIEISDAALESLRELVADGNLDPSMLEELENQKKK